MHIRIAALDGQATEKFIAYHEAKSKGDWGLIITEDYAVDPRGKGFMNITGLWDDSQIEGHSKLTERAHKYGSKTAAQIYHAEADQPLYHRHYNFYLLSVILT